MIISSMIQKNAHLRIQYFKKVLLRYVKSVISQGLFVKMSKCNIRLLQEHLLAMLLPTVTGT